jgi:hypothetical protein
MTDTAEKKYTSDELKAMLAEQEKLEADERELKRQTYEKLKTETIDELFSIASELNGLLVKFKEKAFKDMGALYTLLQEYSNRHKDGKGNFEVENDFYKILFKKQGKGKFDERSVQAEKHIIDFLSTKYEGDLDTKDLIMSLLERKKGDLDIQLVQKLYSMEDRFDDVNWKEGIKLLKESYTYSHSKDYISFYQKDSTGKWENVNLNFSYV